MEPKAPDQMGIEELEIPKNELGNEDVIEADPVGMIPGIHGDYQCIFTHTLT